MVCRCGWCLQSLKGILGHSVREGQPCVLMRREVRRAVGTARPSPSHTPGLHSHLCPKPLIRAAAAHLCPAALPPHLDWCPLRGAQGHAFLLLLWRMCWAAPGEAELALMEGRSLSLTGPV